MDSGYQGSSKESSISDPREVTTQARGIEHEVVKQHEQKKTWLRTVAKALIEQWFLLGLGIVIIIASQVQVSQSQQAVKTDTVAYLIVALIFTITGCTLDTQILIANYARWKVHVFVQMEIYLVASAVVFGFVELIATNKHFLDPGLLVGLIFMSSMPTTMSSNVVMTKQAGGNQELTVVQTTIGNLIGAFVTPALVVMYTSVNTWYNKALPPSTGRWGDIYRHVMMRLGLSLYLPLFVGQVLRYYFPGPCKKVFVDWKLSKIGSLALLVMMWQTFDTAFASRAFTSVPGNNMVFITFFGLGVYLLLLAIAFFSSIIWLPKKDVIAVSYCVPAKGVAIAVPIATAMFDNIDLHLRAKIQIPIVIYQCLQLVAGAILVSIFRKYMTKDPQKEEEKEERGETPHGKQRSNVASVNSIDNP